MGSYVQNHRQNNLRKPKECLGEPARRRLERIAALLGFEAMTKERLENMTIGQLVARYIEIGLAQGDAMRNDENSIYTRLYFRVRAIEEELKSRPGDERHALLPLHQHPEAQFRLNSARATLAIAPQVSRAALQELALSKDFPQAGDAGMSLSNLDEGIYKPT